MKRSNNEPRPEEFPLGSSESRAAARLLAEKRKVAFIPVMCVGIVYIPDEESSPPPMYIACDPRLIGSDWGGWMTRQELETKQHEYDEHEKSRL